MKNKVKNILNVLGWIIIILLCLISVIIFLESSFNGLTFVKVQSNSMSASNIFKNDIRLICRSKHYNIGDIIAFKKNNVIYFHQIVDKTSTGEFITKGSSNAVIDAGTISVNDILGKQIVNLNFNFIETLEFKLTFILVFYLFSISIMLKNFIDIVKHNKEKRKEYEKTK